MEGVDRGELFEYRITTPVSLKRGGSAMVPIGRSKVRAEKQRLWRGGGGPNPDLVFRFDNDTGLVLEEGPAVIYDDGGYAGEAMVPYSARGAEVKLAFAKDLAVRCREQISTTRETVGVRIGDRLLIEEVRDRYAHKLRAESDHDTDVEVIFEVAKGVDRKLDSATAEPFEETASCWRFKMMVPGHGAAQIKVDELARGRVSSDARNLTPAQLERWQEGATVGEGMFDALSAVLASWGAAGDLDTKRTRVREDRKTALERQHRITEQLAILLDTGDEGQLRKRYVAELGAEQDRVRQLEDEIRALSSEAEQLRSTADEKLRSLG